jgi:formylglycine-generating enzyme required for sulfatase activity
MHGNVWEWCLDSFAPYVSGAQQDPFVTGGSQRVLRGGRWDYSSAHCRSAYRVPYDPSFALNSFGFRVVLAPIRVP